MKLPAVWPFAKSCTSGRRPPATAVQLGHASQPSVNNSVRALAAWLYGRSNGASPRQHRRIAHSAQQIVAPWPWPCPCCWLGSQLKLGLCLDFGISCFGLSVHGELKLGICSSEIFGPFLHRSLLSFLPRYPDKLPSSHVGVGNAGCSWRRHFAIPRRSCSNRRCLAALQVAAVVLTWPGRLPEADPALHEPADLAAKQVVSTPPSPRARICFLDSAAYRVPLSLASHARQPRGTDLDALGDHRAACPRAGLPHGRGHFPAARRPAYGGYHERPSPRGVQLTVDTTLVSSLDAVTRGATSATLSVWPSSFCSHVRSSCAPSIVNVACHAMIFAKVLQICDEARLCTKKTCRTFHLRAIRFRLDSTWSAESSSSDSSPARARSAPPHLRGSSAAVWVQFFSFPRTLFTSFSPRREAGRLAVADVPGKIASALRIGRMVALTKPTGGVRALASDRGCVSPSRGTHAGAAGRARHSNSHLAQSKRNSHALLEVLYVRQPREKDVVLASLVIQKACDVLTTPSLASGVPCPGLTEMDLDVGVLGQRMLGRPQSEKHPLRRGPDVHVIQEGIEALVLLQPGVNVEKGSMLAERV